MIIFTTQSGERIVYVDTRWARSAVYPRLMRAHARGLLTIVGTTAMT